MRSCNILFVLASTFILCTSACSSSSDAPQNLPPVFDPIPDQTAFLDAELTFEIKASDPEGAPITFSFVSDIPNVSARARIQSGTAGSALFRFTPIATDIGPHSFDFIAFDGAIESHQQVVIDIQESSSGNSIPVFVKPLGSGTTLDLGVTPCLDLAIEVEDPDTKDVVINQEPPLIDQAVFEQISGHSATFHWCPSKEQVEASDRYALVMSADDNQHPKTIRNFLIVLRKPTTATCAGSPPAIFHTPSNQTTILNIGITAKVTDDKGIKHAPLLYYSSTKPASPPDLSQLAQITMVQKTGDLLDGTWTTSIPNPVADKPAGTKTSLYYVIVAQDNDDPATDCFHITQAPATGTYQVDVTSSGGNGGLAPCEPCISDNQCGGPTDNCLTIGSESKSYCSKACSSDTQCGVDYACSPATVKSIGGVDARQCIPKSNSCIAAPTTCKDDKFEENDSLVQAKTATALPPGAYTGLMSCPATSTEDDEDFYKISVTEDSQFAFTLSGDGKSDLDMMLYDLSGKSITRSDKTGSNESMVACLTPGDYFARVYTWDTAASSYAATLSTWKAACKPVCSDDTLEPDDSSTQARTVDLSKSKYTSQTNAVCPGNEDWYKLDLKQGTNLYATVAFIQDNVHEDLDINFYKGSTNLTPCFENSTAACDPKNGQSADSNENFTYKIAETTTYYLVVRGRQGSTNLYDICISQSSTACPQLP